MKKGLLIAATLVAFGMAAPMAQAVTYRIQATLAPNLNNGPDPRGLSGFSSVFLVNIPSNAAPASANSTSASYYVAAGEMRMISNESTGAHTYISTGKGTVTMIVGPKGKNILRFQGPFSVMGQHFQIITIVTLANGSFTSAVLRHPTKFSPTDQTISSPSSDLIYSLMGVTKLGLQGNAIAK